MPNIMGTITEIYEIETGETKTGREWKKQSFKIDQGDMHNPEVVITVMGDERIRNLSKNKVGDYVEVTCYINSREYNGKFYHNINGWTIFNKNHEITKDEVDKGNDFVTTDDNENLPF
jgi:hypothetical protein